MKSPMMKVGGNSSGGKIAMESQECWATGGALVWEEWKHPSCPEYDHPRTGRGLLECGAKAETPGNEDADCEESLVDWRVELGVGLETALASPSSLYVS
jgi:hypothetical protein